MSSNVEKGKTNNIKNNSSRTTTFNTSKNNYSNFINISNGIYQNNDIKQRMLNAEQKRKREMARKSLLSLSSTNNESESSDSLESEEKDKFFDSLSKPKVKSDSKTASTVIRNIIKTKKRIYFLLLLFLPLIILIIFVTIIGNFFGNAKFSIENEGTVKSDDYEVDDPNINYFKNYPGLYEEVEKVSKKVSNEYLVEIDKNLIISTLVSPIESGLIVPVEGNCGEPACYKFNNQFLTWNDFLKNWIAQVEYLAKAQIMTYVPKDSNFKVNCSNVKTIEAISKNDKSKNEFGILGWLNPVNWFKGFVDDKVAEVNAKCVEPPFGESRVPIVRRLSIELPNYYKKIDENGKVVLEKDENSGGVYFWNLVNKDGFIHKYLKDYLDLTYSDDVDKNYEINKMKIVDVANEIYLHHQASRITCGDYKVIESKIINIKVLDPKTNTVSEVPFEDQYIGGVMLAEYNSGDLESLKAFAILARTEAAAVVGVNGEGTIENSSNDQNYNPNYSPEKYPKLAQAVKETRGMVLSQHFSPKVWKTEYDAFCPVRRDKVNGFWYLPDGQRNLPINPDVLTQVSGKVLKVSEKYLRCPCFQNNNSQPHDVIIGRAKIKFSKTPGSPNLEPSGTPAQSTYTECWLPTDHTRVNNNTKATEYGWRYKATGGHGRGASQLGLFYFEGFGYDYVALNRLFFEGAAIRYLSSSIDLNTCTNAKAYTGEKG